LTETRNKSNLNMEGARGRVVHPPNPRPVHPSQKCAGLFLFRGEKYGISKWIRNMENGIEERSVYGDFPPEGLVLRPCVTLYDHQHERIITKLKYKDFA